MAIQQQNYLFVIAMQRWYIFFIKSIINLCESPFPFFLQTAIYSEHQNAWLARLQVMLMYPICIAFDSNGEMIVVWVNKYFSGMIIWLFEMTLSMDWRRQTIRLPTPLQVFRI